MKQHQRRTALHHGQPPSPCDREKMARLRKQVADLKARLRRVDEVTATMSLPLWLRMDLRPAVDLKNKSWRKGGK